MKVPYKIDLPRQQAQCSHNYARLLKLLPDLDSRERWAIALDSGEMEIQVQERARYTTTLSVSQRDSALTLWSQALTLTVRLYHDADMAEVVAWDHHRQLQPRYSYPNRDMYHEDEKSQLNHFLGDWLSHSLGCGRAVETVNISE